jgi:hypothetical protein
MTEALTGPQWRVFLYALADEVDGMGGPGARDELLRNVGRRMATLRPTLPVPSLDLLEAEINEILSVMGWGSAALRFNEADHQLVIAHTGLPRIGAAGDPPGSWLGAVLEGLYQGWLNQIPGADPALVVRRQSVTPQTVTLRYARSA